MLISILLVLSLIIVFGSLKQIFTSIEMGNDFFSLETFMSLLFLYSVLLLGFGLIYAIMTSEGIHLFHNQLINEQLSWYEELKRGVYFSGVTLFTVGYGDLMPIGYGRFLALFEAMIGYALPAALMIKAFRHDGDNH
ncbi:potassium channel family protein [Thalassobacillus sp. CUG 92003]|uniref:potassium channel family protein n=1 Tax=Thalassobacillus sp. CUG 92003 TaxID=2736641 RepID=UPI0015E6837F|nr:potassium channel family protein [Thalassobacillus sp. CUG 92003]